MSESIYSELEKLKPWHMAIQLTDEISTATPFAEHNLLTPSDNEGVTLIDLRDHLLNPIDRIYPKGLRGKRFLDCACNSGGYSFWAKEREVDETFGFDVRSHWIDQAEYVKRTRIVAPTDNMTFMKCNLYDVADLNLPKFNITMFKGLFYHLPQPVLGLKIAADLTSELLWFNSAFMADRPDGYLQPVFESTEKVMSGVHRLAWIPTGPKAIGMILQWLGFVDIRLVFARKSQNRPNLGRIEILAARDRKLLKPIARMTKRLHFDGKNNEEVANDEMNVMNQSWLFQRLRCHF